MSQDKLLDDIARQERIEYYRQWRQKNKDKVKKHQETYWKKRATKKLNEQEQ